MPQGRKTACSPIARPCALHWKIKN